MSYSLWCWRFRWLGLPHQRRLPLSVRLRHKERRWRFGGSSSPATPLIKNSGRRCLTMAARLPTTRTPTKSGPWMQMAQIKVKWPMDSGQGGCLSPRTLPTSTVISFTNMCPQAVTSYFIPTPTAPAPLTLPPSSGRQMRAR